MNDSIFQYDYSRGSLLISLVSLVTWVVQALLGLRFILKLLGASSVAPFVRWVYETTDSLLTPFEGMFTQPALTGPFVLEITTLFAIIAYTFAGYLIIHIVRLLEASMSPPNKK